MAWFVTQSLVIILLTFALGLVVGWLWWGRAWRRVPLGESAAVQTVARRLEGILATREGEILRLRAMVTGPTDADSEQAPAEDTATAPAATGTEQPEAPDDGPGGSATDAGEAAAAPEPDDLERIEGIGPRIAAALHDAGIRSYPALARADEEELRSALRAAGLAFAPSLVTWSRQAALLAEGDEAGFDALIAQIVGGRSRAARAGRGRGDALPAEPPDGTVEPGTGAATADATAPAAAETTPAQAEAAPAEAAPVEAEATPAEAGAGPEPGSTAGAEPETGPGIEPAPEPAAGAVPASAGGEHGAAGTEAAAEPPTEQQAATEQEPPADVQPPAAADAGEGATKEDEEDEEDLERVEGIGPRIATALRKAGIRTFRQLADSELPTLQAALEASGLRYAPSLPTWPRQAALLADGDEDGFLALTDTLVAGRDPGRTAR